MSGIKGRSGKVTTPEHHAAVVRAAQLGGRAKAAGKKSGQDDQKTIPADNSAALSDDEILAMLPGANPYDAVVLRAKGKFTYLDGKTREQVNGEVLANEKLALIIEQTRKELFTREQVDEMDAAKDAIVLRHLETVAQFAASLVAPDKALEAQRSAAEWLRKVRQGVAAEMNA